MPARKKKASERKYGGKATKKVGDVLREMKAGKLTSGRSGRKVTSRKQAIAIGLSEARAEGDKVPPFKPASRKKASAKKASRKKTPAKKSSRGKSG
jgi:hypothetical protein